MNKVEEVARALAQHVGPYAFDDCPADKAALKAGEWSTNDFTQSDLLEMARAVIEAMKGPTKSMMADGWASINVQIAAINSLGLNKNIAAGRVFEDMLQAALNE